MQRSVDVLDHGFVRLDGALADDLSVANAARVSFARRKESLEAEDEGLIRFLMRERHGTPFEHNAFRFHVRCPIFVAREWFRHRIGCLTGDTAVTFVDTNGWATPKLTKTIDELWHLWSVGEANGHAPSEDVIEQIEERLAAGASERSIATELGVGRRIVRQIRSGRDVRFRDARRRVRKMRIRVLNEDTGEFTTGHIADIFDKGEQPVYEIALADGKSLQLTVNHRVLTTEGWATLGEAVGLEGVGEDARITRPCELLVNGVELHRSPQWLRQQREAGRSVSEMAEEAGCSYHTIRKWLARSNLRFEPGEASRGRTPWNQGKRYRTGHRLSAAHRTAIARARAGERSNFWRGGVTPERALIGAWTTSRAARLHQLFDYTCQECKRRGGRLCAHHIVPVWLDARLATTEENLVTLCDRCHRRVHATVASELAFAEQHRFRLAEPFELPTRPRVPARRLAAHGVEVVSIRYLGVRRTFDLSIAGPWHNFVANGIVVHNSFNEFSMRYAQASDDFYVPEAGDVRSQVGKPGAYTFEPVDDELALRTREELREVYDHAYATYERLVSLGVARELARAVMPVGAYTEFFWTLNARALMNFLSLRNAEAAQREIRRYAEACEVFFEEAMPVTYAAFVANERRAP
jgi:thymidylate synthase (FAD)